MNSFELLDARLRRIVAGRFPQPTEIQEKAMPLVLKGEDVLAIAPTGWGKMEAAFLPILNQLLFDINAGRKEGVRVLYITPLRALNRDMLERMTYWCHLLGVSIAVRHGDTTQTERVRQREKPPQVLITTPESVNTLLIAPGLRYDLANVKWVVVDEIHELIDTKRGTQLSIALERLRERTGGFQAIGLSATVGDEKKAAEFISKKALVARADFKRGISLKVECPKASGEKEFKDAFKLDAGTAGRLERIVDLIDKHSSILIFVNTRSLAESLAALLYQVEELKDKISVHHGSLAKESRISTETEFKKKEKKLKAIVCTSSLELGIDIGDIDLVIQYHSPRQVTRLLQRIGRSGHRRDLTPKGVILAVSGTDCAESAVLARRSIAGELEKTSVSENALDVLAQQVAGIVLDEPEGKAVDVEKAFAIVKRAMPYSALELKDFVEVCKQLSYQRLVAMSTDLKQLLPSRATKLYYYENLSTIPDLRRYAVKDAARRKIVAMLDEDFVAEYLQPGAAFISKGTPWKVLSVTEDAVVVEQAGDYTAAVPDWVGEELPVTFETGQEVAWLLGEVGTERKGGWELARDYACDRKAAGEIIDFSKKQASHFLPRKETIFIESSGNNVIVHTFAGNRANEAIARAVSLELSGAAGQSVRSKAGPYLIAFELPARMASKKMAEIITGLRGGEMAKAINAAVPSTSLFRHRFVHVAKRFGLIRRDADLKRINLRRLVEANAGTPIFKETLREMLAEKLDVPAAAEVAGWKIVIADKEELSPLAREFLDFYEAKELFSPAEPTAQVLKAFTDNILSKRAELICNYCGNAFSISLKEEGGKGSVKCPHCKSSQLTLAGYRQVIAKAGKGLGLDAEERRRLSEARRVESLIDAYGRRALVALEAYGVGPETAARLLSRLGTDEQFYHSLLDAQKKFIANRRFWKA